MTANRPTSEQISFLLKFIIDLRNLSKDRLSPDEVRNALEPLTSSVFDNPDLNPDSKELYQKVLMEDSSPLLQELQSTTRTINLPRAFMAELYTLDPYTCAQTLFCLPDSLTDDAYHLILDKTKAPRVIQGAEKLRDDWYETFLTMILQGPTQLQLSSHLKDLGSENDHYGFHSDVEILLQIRLVIYQSSLLQILDQLLEENYQGFTTRVDLLRYLIQEHERILSSPHLQISIFPYLIWQGKRFGNAKEQSDQYAHNMLRIFERYWKMLSSDPFPLDRSKAGAKRNGPETKPENPFVPIFKENLHAEKLVNFLDKKGFTANNGTRWLHQNGAFIGLRDALCSINHENSYCLLDTKFEAKSKIGVFINEIYGSPLKKNTVRNSTTSQNAQVVKKVIIDNSENLFGVNLSEK